MGTRGVLRENSGSVRTRGRLNSPWEQPEDTGEFVDYKDALWEELAGRLEGGVRADKVESILRMMKMILRGSDLFWWKVDVFPSGSFYFLYEVINEDIYQERKGKVGMQKKEIGFGTVVWQENQISMMY